MEQNYLQEMMEEEYKKPRKIKPELFIISLILTIVLICAAFTGGYFVSKYTHNVVSDEEYKLIKSINPEYVKYVNNFDLLFKSLGYADANFFKELDYQALDEKAALAVMNSLDDYSMMARSEDLIDSAIKASVGAIISTSVYNEYTVQYVFDDSLAHGLLFPGDRIYAVNDNRVEGLPMEYFRFYTSGGEGTVLKLTIDRPVINGGNKTYARQDISVTKSITTNKQAYYINNLDSRELGAPNRINDDIGYIKLLSFSGNAYNDFTGCINQFTADGNKALILDLRNNGGGSGEILNKIAGYLVRDNDKKLKQNVPIIELQNVKTGKTQIFETANSYNYLDIPIYILCNGNTASASEALLGAIQYYGTGTIIGTKTYGKGVAQYVDYSKPVQDDNGTDYTISLTIGYYYVYTRDTAKYPEGKYTIDKIGIIPDSANTISKEQTDASAGNFNYYDDPFIARANALYVPKQ